jgi:hypothetical protein
MVEEMMLLANEAVAAKIFSAFPACALLRNHPVPHPNMLVPLQNLAALFKIPLDTRSNKVIPTVFSSFRQHCHLTHAQTLAASLSAVSDPNDPFVSKVFLPLPSFNASVTLFYPFSSKLMSIFATRCMPQAM